MEYSYNFHESNIGRGIQALYCWRSDCLCPVGLILYTLSGDGHEGVEARIRADILHIYVVEWARDKGVGEKMIHELQRKSDVIHNAVASNQAAESLLNKTGFTYIPSSINWSWIKPVKTKISSGFNMNAYLALLLGWTHVEFYDYDDRANTLCGVPPNEKNVIPIPAWSTDETDAVILLLAIAERYKLDYQWWKEGKYYCCGMKEVSQDRNYYEDQMSPWYNTLALSVCDTVVSYLARIHGNEETTRTFSELSMVDLSLKQPNTSSESVNTSSLKQPNTSSESANTSSLANDVETTPVSENTVVVDPQAEAS